MKQFLAYLTTVLVLSVTLTTASLGRSDTGPPDKVVTNHQTDVIAMDIVNTITVPAAIQVSQERSCSDIASFPVNEKAIKKDVPAPLFDPFYNERRWGERTQYFITESLYNLRTTYHLRC